MLTAISFKAKPGRADELRALLADPDTGRRMARAMGAQRNTLFLNPDGRMIRVLDFPPNARPTPFIDLVARDAKVREFARRLSAILEDGFDVDDPDSLRAFEERNSFELVFDVEV